MYYVLFDLAGDGSGDLPVGQFVDSPVQPLSQKYFVSRLTQITSYPIPSRPPEGRIMIVTDVGHGMRWTRQRRARK
jgi:hypothetical protein